jgi:hypothetical protein
MSARTHTRGAREVRGVRRVRRAGAHCIAGRLVPANGDTRIHEGQDERRAEDRIGSDQIGNRAGATPLPRSAVESSPRTMTASTSPRANGLATPDR